MKRILPILLAIVIICSCAWYLFIYDRGFTRDLLLNQARFFEENGKHDIAAWLYSSAYLQTDENEIVAIELSDHFKSIGNYTKAETTLTDAIADGGSAELYIALCKTYVEQNKLLDAVTMLDNISDPAIKEELDALRPKLPQNNYAPGSYSQYITVTLSDYEGTLYATTDGTYPSTDDTPSTGEFTLVGGENRIFALVLGDNGLVSPLAIYGYTVGGVVEEVTLKDSAIDAAVRKKLGVSADAALQSSQLWTITSLKLSGVESYDDLAYLTGLEVLNIQDGTGESLEGLRNMSYLNQLILTDCVVSTEDLQIIGALPSLTKLTLTGCSLSSIENLSTASKLTTLNLSNNTIRDLSPLSFMTGLTELNLSHNALNSLNALSSLSSLKVLDVSYNALSSVAPLSSCQALTKLYVGNNTLENLSGLENIKGLATLSAAYNSITDVTALKTMNSITNLDLSSNKLTDISCLASLTKLQKLNFSRNQVKKLPEWDRDCALVTIDGSYNELGSITTLAGYKNLNEVLMDYNNLYYVNSLANCPNLIKVSVYGNEISDVSELTARDIIVNYNPL
ncbi:MAG: leucine-rich repeat domain-containing protein [Oscillospiraceae bacterium]|nr:leucine-rich repeat domain-containing protein [Oscillospiraceae bacterium]